MKRIIITVTNDLQTDQRMHKTALNLKQGGFNVLLLGRKLPVSEPLSREYATHRMKLWVKRGALFYAWFNFRLFWYLLFHAWDIVLACDMDTLPAAYLASKIRRKALVFDSHELFSEVPEIQHKKCVKKVWVSLEAYFLPKIKHAYTVSQSIADYYHNKYGIEMKIIRNLPMSFSANDDLSKEKSGGYLMYQGALNQGRGLEKLIEAMNFLPDLYLKIAGDGLLRKDLEQLVKMSKANDRITFLGRLDFDALRKVTQDAILGFSLEEDLGLNYRFALPNKLFDYMQAGVPSVVSALPEMKAVIETTGAGYLVKSSCSSKDLADKIRNVLSDKEQYAKTQELAIKASKTYNWEQESKRQLEIFELVLNYYKT